MTQGQAGEPIADQAFSDEPFADVAETHTAAVFFAGDRAYKLKRPVRTGFLDFSTAERRAVACRRETELNRRFAPDVYLGVLEVRDEAGAVVDHLVAMRRMPADRRLSALIARGENAAHAVRQVARLVAAQHAAALRSPAISEQGSVGALGRRWTDNIDQTRPIQDRLFDGAITDEVERLARRYLAGRELLLDARVSAGHIVDGHGDLQAGDIFCLADGPRILDCLEFDDTLRWLDGLDDAAFLAMDLERLGAAELAERFTAWYAEFSGDPAPVSLRHLYVAYRAFVRAKVSCIRAAQRESQAAAEAGQLAALALRHLRAGAVTMVLVGGLPGTGKSALAGTLASQLGWTVLGSDRIRKELAGLAPSAPSPAPFGAGIYSPEWTDRTYAELLSRAARLASMGESLILDATWSDAGQRAAAAKIARQVAADLVELHCAAPAEVTAHRMRGRADGESDADPLIAAELAARADPWPEAVLLDNPSRPESGTDGAGTPGQWPAALVRTALEAIRPHGPEHVWRRGSG